MYHIVQLWEAEFGWAIVFEGLDICKESGGRRGEIRRTIFINAKNTSLCPEPVDLDEGFVSYLGAPHKLVPVQE